jgi:hypothetical protein
VSFPIGPKYPDEVLHVIRQGVQKILPTTHSSASGGFVPILSLSSQRIQVSFINEIFKISLFLPEAVKIDFENAKRASDVKAVKWTKDNKDS